VRTTTCVPTPTDRRRIVVELLWRTHQKPEGSSGTDSLAQCALVRRRRMPMHSTHSRYSPWRLKYVLVLKDSWQWGRSLFCSEARTWVSCDIRLRGLALASIDARPRSRERPPGSSLVAQL